MPEQLNKTKTVFTVSFACWPLCHILSSDGAGFTWTPWWLEQREKKHEHFANSESLCVTPVISVYISLAKTGHVGTSESIRAAICHLPSGGML